MLKPILWPPDLKNWLTGKDPDVGKDWRQEEKGTTEDEMVRWHHWLDGHEFEQASGVGDGHGSLVCCSPWGRKELDMTERLNWTDGPSVIERHQEPKVRRKERTTEGWTWQGAAVPKTSTESESCSVVSDFLWPHGLYSPWNSPGQNTGVGSCYLLQGIFPTQESNWGLLHCRRTSIA